MRHFIVCRHPKNESGTERNHLAVTAANPVRAVELYAQHLAGAMPVAFVQHPSGSKRMLVSVMEIALDDEEGVRTAVHSEGDLYYTCRLHDDGTATATFLEQASEYASDGETPTGEWG